MSASRKVVERLVPLNIGEISFLQQLVRRCREKVQADAWPCTALVDRVGTKLDRASAYHYRRKGRD